MITQRTDIWVSLGQPGADDPERRSNDLEEVVGFVHHILPGEAQDALPPSTNEWSRRRSLVSGLLPACHRRPITSIAPAAGSRRPCNSAGVHPATTAPGPAHNTVTMQRMRLVIGAASTLKTRGRSGSSRPLLRRPRMSPRVTPPLSNCPSATTPCCGRTSNWRYRSISREFIPRIQDEVKLAVCDSRHSAPRKCFTRLNARPRDWLGHERCPVNGW